MGRMQLVIQHAVHHYYMCILAHETIFSKALRLQDFLYGQAVACMARQLLVMLRQLLVMPRKLLVMPRQLLILPRKLPVLPRQLLVYCLGSGSYCPESCLYCVGSDSYCPERNSYYQKMTISYS